MASSYYKVTLTANSTLALTGWSSTVQECVIEVVQDGSGGHTLTLPSVTWPVGSTPVVNSAANATTILMFTSLDSGATITGTAFGAETERAESVEATMAVVTDGMGGTGATFTVGSVAPGSLGQRGLFFDTSYNPLIMGAWVANRTYKPDAWVTNGGTLYQNLTAAPLASGSVFSATGWTSISTNGGTTISTSIPNSPDSPGAAGTSTQSSAADHIHPFPLWLPSDHGLISWSFDCATPVNGFQPSSNGLLQVVKLHVPVAATVTNILLGITTVGGTLGSTQNYAALYSSAKALLAKTADQGTNWSSGGAGLRTMALATSQAVSAGDVYVVFWANGTTLPTFLRSSGLAGMPNAGIATAANSRFATANTTITGTPPGTLGTFTALDVSYWVALS